MGTEVQSTDDAKNSWFSSSASDVLRLLMVFILSVLFSANLICLSAVKEPGNTRHKFHFEFVVVTILQEIFKFAIAFAMLQQSSCARAKDGAMPDENLDHLNPAKKNNVFKWRNFFLFAVPGLLYAFDNNFQYVILQFVAPAELAILWNFKIVATAVLLHAFLGRRYSAHQWLALCVLIMGCAMTQASNFSLHSAVGPHHPVAQPIHHEDGSSIVVSDSSRLTSSVVSETSPKLIGVVLAIIGSSIAASSNVFLEWLIKRAPGDSLHFQNMQLYFWGILLNFGALVMKFTLEPESPIHGQAGLFTGFSVWVWVIISMGSITGITISMTLKFVDNIAVVFAHVVAVCLVAVVSARFFNLGLSLPFMAGGFLIAVALIAFHSEDCSKRALVAAGAAGRTRKPGELTEAAKLPKEDGPRYCID